LIELLRQAQNLLEDYLILILLNVRNTLNLLPMKKEETVASKFHKSYTKKIMGMVNKLVRKLALLKYLKHSIILRRKRKHWKRLKIWISLKS